MKKRIALLFIFILVVTCIPVSAASSPQTAPTIQLSHTTKIVHSAKKNYITGKISAANGQRVVLYDSKGKAISLQKLSNDGLPQDFKLPAPTLEKGRTVFVVRAESIGNIPASNAATITLYYKDSDVAEYIKTSEQKSNGNSFNSPKSNSEAIQAAIDWAIMIANDDSFTYGHKPQTSHVGCYFCGTNKRNKPKGYEKTYVCMTFVHAAYAHGAGDPAMLKDCQKGTHCLSVYRDTLKSGANQYGCWAPVGYTKDLKSSDLQPGDVLIWVDKHMAMYLDDKHVVDAGGYDNGWTARTIAVRKMNWRKATYVIRYTGQGGATGLGANSIVNLLMVDDSKANERVKDRFENLGAKVTIVKKFKPSQVNKYDGLIIPGGNNVTPSLYGEENNGHTTDTDLAKDKNQIKAVLAFSEANKPIFGICRGMQLINVAFGGTIDQGNGKYHKGWHTVKIGKDSAFYKTFGSKVKTYHYHKHQVKDLAPGFKATQWATDKKGTNGKKVIEAMEHTSKPIYCLQWHCDVKKAGDDGDKACRVFIDAVMKYKQGAQ